MTWIEGRRKKFKHDAKFFYWDEPYMYKQCSDGIIRRCVSGDEAKEILEQCHSSPYGGHLKGQRTAMRILQCGFFLPFLFKDAH